MKSPFASGFVVSSPYGVRDDPFTGERLWHGGVDLVGNDRNVRSVATGYVLRSRIVTDKMDKTSEWGNYVAVMGEADGRIIYYCHLDRRAVNEGQRVEAGQIIGIEGSTGRVTGMHLHFEVRDSAGRQLDPCAYLGIPNREGYEYDPPEPWEEQAHDWSLDAVRWAVENGILRGDGNGNYRLQDPLTREEMCVLLWRTVGNGV